MSVAFFTNIHSNVITAYGYHVVYHDYDPSIYNIKVDLSSL